MSELIIFARKYFFVSACVILSGIYLFVFASCGTKSSGKENFYNSENATSVTGRNDCGSLSAILENDVINLSKPLPRNPTIRVILTPPSQALEKALGLCEKLGAAKREDIIADGGHVLPGGLGTIVIEENPDNHTYVKVSIDSACDSVLVSEIRYVGTQYYSQY